MKIFLRHITDQETELNFTQDDEWLQTAVERVDERLEEIERISASPTPKRKSKRAIEAHLSLRKVDEVVVVNGTLKTHINLLCSRCAAPFQFDVSPRFSGLFCKDPVLAGVGHLDDEAPEGSKPAGQNQGFARHAHDDSEESGETGRDLDITYVSQDFIELGDVLTEQLRLQVPFQPLCKESCQGICTRCGADLNSGRCACAKIAKQTQFSVLKNLKL